MPIIGVVGVGGCGRQVLQQLADSEKECLSAVAVDTEVERMGGAVSIRTKLIGKYGSGGDPMKAQRLFDKNVDDLEECFRGKDVMVIVAGLGGGTGSGIAPRIARRAKAFNPYTLVAAAVTMPFAFEGAKRQEAAAEALIHLEDEADVVVVVDNKRMPLLGDVSMAKAFATVDGLMLAAVRGIASYLSLYDDDIHGRYAALRRSGRASVFTAAASGERAVAEALAQLQASPLSDIKDLARCKRLNLLIETSQERSLLVDEFGEITEVVQKLFDDKNPESGRQLDYLVDRVAMDSDLRITLLAFAL